MPKAVIMAGGQGERFWPLTHEKFPKYRIRFEGKDSLLQGTYKRLLKYFKSADIYVVTTREHVRLIREELPTLPKNRYLVEPFRNNTASALLYSTSYLFDKYGSQEVVCHFPADHLIQKKELFLKTIKEASHIALSHETLVTIGIKPTFPAIGYGYILCDEPIQKSSSAFQVKRFVEKPNRERAAEYLASGGYLWNAGIFAWRAGVFLNMMREFAKEFNVFSLKKLSASYQKMPKLSIDVALLEKASSIAVVSTSMDWCDMGSWEMVYEKSNKDSSRNVVLGNVRLTNVRESLVANYSKKPLLAWGLDKQVLIQTDLGLLSCPLGRSEEAARQASVR